MRRPCRGLLRGASAAILLFLVAAVCLAGEAALPPPQDEIILTVTGKIGRGNAQGATGNIEARFDRAMLERLGMTEVVTGTPWHAGKVRFEGVLLRRLLTAVAAEGDSLRAVAHNDYTANLPVEDAKRYDVILALKANGQELTLRQKGPIFVIYPYDRDSALRKDIIYYRSVWQLRSLEIR